MATGFNRKHCDLHPLHFSLPQRKDALGESPFSSISSPTTHFSLKNPIFYYKMTREFSGSFHRNCIFFKWRKQRFLHSSLTATFQHGSWFSAHYRTPASVALRKTPNHVGLTIKLADLAVLPAPFGPFPLRAAPRWPTQCKAPCKFTSCCFRCSKIPRFKNY